MKYSTIIVLIVILFSNTYGTYVHARGIEPVLLGTNQIPANTMIHKSERKGLAQLWYWVKKKIWNHWAKFFLPEESEKGNSLVGWWIALLSSGLSIVIGRVFFESTIGGLLFGLGSLGYFIFSIAFMIILLSMQHKESQKPKSDVAPAWFNWSWVVFFITSLTILMVSAFTGNIFGQALWGFIFLRAVGSFFTLLSLVGLIF